MRRVKKTYLFNMVCMSGMIYALLITKALKDWRKRVRNKDTESPIDRFKHSHPDSPPSSIGCYRQGTGPRDERLSQRENERTIQRPHVR